ncbi:MAG: mucoidy inhibitor MuiA family protein [Candidatus Coatesbacteria bacterium]
MGQGSSPWIRGVGMALALATAGAAGAGTPAAATTGRRELVAKPVAVTVYQQMARVEREGVCRLGAGPSTVVFGDLPASADEGSLRVWLKGPKGTRLHGVEVVTMHGSEAVETRVRKLRRRIRELEDRKAVIDDRNTARADELRILRGWDAKTRKGTGGKDLPFTELSQGAEAIGRRIGVLLAETRKDSMESRDLSEQIGVLQRDVQAAGSAQTDRRVVEVELDAAVEGPVSFRLAYTVREARWEPVYDLTLDTASKEPAVGVSFGARVCQQTGESWDGVKLALSTARPAGVTQAPDPREGWAVEASGQRRGGVVLSAAPRARREASDGDGPADNPVTIGFDPATVASAEYAARFEIARPVSVKSGAEARRVGISESSHPAALSIVTEPRRSLAAFVEAKLTYQADAPLLAGPAHLFQGGEFVGTTMLKAVAPGEEVTLGFGQDASLRIERRLVEQKVTEGGFGSRGTMHRRYRWVTTLVSGHAGTRTIEVRERVPESRQTDVEIRLGDVSPGLLPDDPDLPGLKRWRIEVAPGTPATVEFGYTVRSPKGRSVAGLG